MTVECAGERWAVNDWHFLNLVIGPTGQMILALEKNDIESKIVGNPTGLFRGLSRPLYEDNDHRAARGEVRAQGKMVNEDLVDWTSCQES